MKETKREILRDFVNPKKRYKRIKRFLVCILIVSVLAISIIYLWELFNKNYKDYKVIKSNSNTGETAVGYLSYGNEVIKYSKDGAVALDHDGNLLWNGSYEMSDPIADICGKYVVIADRGNKSIYIYNGKSNIRNITTLYNITKLAVSAQGIVAVMMYDEDNNYITLYSSDGTELVNLKKDINVSGYLLDMALSEDGKKLVVSFLSFNTGELMSNVAFYNFGEIGQNYTDRSIGGGYKYKGVVIPRVSFLDNDTVCIYKDNGIVICSMIETPKVIYEENYDRKIKSILYSEKYTGVVLEKDDTYPSLLLLYNLKGKKILNSILDFDYDNIMLMNDEIIMHNNLSCFIMRTNGRIKFKYTFEKDFNEFYTINNLNRYYLINTFEIAVVELTE